MSKTIAKTTPKKDAKKSARSNTNVTTASFDNPLIFSRDQHPVSRKLLSPNALKVLYRLNKGGFDAYLVGGGVRDILLGFKPKDFDIATNATPDEIKELFRNCRLIGRRFRLAHIVFGREIIEVATFRGHHDNASEQEKSCKKTSKQSEDGMLLRDNIYGSIEEDAERRDFTINALYYSAKDFKVYDFANGVQDVNDKVIRLIGDPETRYREDPVRMLRAIRFATKLDMQISDDTKAPIKELSTLMANIPAARLFEEFLKMFIAGKAVANFEQLRSYNLFGYFFPAVEQALNDESDQQRFLLDFIMLAMENTDKRINNDQRVTPAFLFAAMLWYPLQKHIQQIKVTTQLTPQDIFFAALNEIMPEQQRSIAIPKRFQAVIKDIWILQDKLGRREGKRAFKTLEHPKFRAGYDFLLLRAQIEDTDELKELAHWWTDFQEVSNEARLQMIKGVKLPQGAKRRPAKKRRKPAAKPPEA
ncbi:polynucleotide adenylyltransferase PcnB [Colwellia sp. Bg11-28]|uniref:polynucleotide adenylyltransferase PcnB n=1 Tax=Colwellia sp. Bg11-28 TaxID=2058305 RepID=UPI000C3440C9|nr:polynucleotide adenylyltransferase PcnB [Colwellia sp. Bg11-28]PKH85485.1 polynucleotide adenylyltransferase PcnB [Colwellia sp. Bg11-28]